MKNQHNIKWSLNNGDISVQSVIGEVLSMQALSGSVTIDKTQYCLKEAKANSDKTEFLFPNGIRWSWDVREVRQQLEVVAVLRNESKEGVRIDKWNILQAKSEKGGIVNLGQEPGSVRFFRWIPWEMGVECLNSDKDYHSKTLCHLYDSVSGVTLLTAFSSIDRMSCECQLSFQKESGVTEFRATCLPSEYLLPPGKELRSEVLTIGYYKDPYQALEIWADEINKRYKPSFEGTAGVCLGNVGAWVDVFSSQEDERTNIFYSELKASDEKFAGFGIDLIAGGTHTIMKDGLPGNWLTFEGKSNGREFDEVLCEQHEKGWNYKLWFSPFWFFGEAEGILEENRENLLKNENGDPIKVTFWNGWEFGRGPYGSQLLTKYYLDGTHPKTLEYLKKVFSRYREVGARAYMLDFLDIPPGARRYDESALPLESARAIMKELRAAAGWDTHLQTAVASSPSFVGCVNSARVVRDYGEGRPMYPLPNWQNATYCMHDKHFSNAHSFVQNAAAAWFTNKKVYVNDLNELTIDQPIPLEHARVTITMFGLSGDSPIRLGDNIGRIAPDRLRMLKMCLPRTTDIPVPVDLFDSPEPEGCRILKKSVTTKYDSYTLAAVFNTVSEQEIFKTEIDLAKLGLNTDNNYRVYEFWNGEYIGTFRNSFPCSIPPGSCRLFRISVARSYPWLLSTDFHVEQGRAEVESLTYDEKTMTLSGVATRPVGEQGRLIFLMPRQFRLVNHERVNIMKEVLDMQNIISLPLDFSEDKIEFCLKFEHLDSPFVARPGWLPYKTTEEWLEYRKNNQELPQNRIIE